MGRDKIKEDEDRYLIERKGNFHYKRRVPLKIAHLDKRAPHVRVSLKTSDRKLARRKRDLLEEADDTLWASLAAAGASDDAARRRFEAAVRRVEAMGYSFRPSSDFEGTDVFNSLVERLRVAIDQDKPDDVAKQLLGMVDAPKTRVNEAFDLYCNEIVADELIGKSQAQRDQWKKVKRRAVNNFILLNGDLPMDEIALDHAKKVYRYWLGRIAPKEGKATASFSSGNRDLGNMRVLYDAYFRHMGDAKRENPFAGLGFSTKRKKKRPPFPTDWITGTLLKVGSMATLNEEARRILLIIIETGARPSEICNLDAKTIMLADPVPHLVIEPREDPDDPREIKTESSRRKVPLVGVALEAAKKQPAGFPQYRNKENNLSAALNAYFKENDLFPTPAHKIYSLRHSFEDRMKVGGIDAELRKIIMGHSIDRPDYGVGGTLEWRQENLMRIALPFDPAIV
ncbi:MAG: integrase [Mesorhizobium sp.]|nr:MAG: integrase [Mesorhizobium sp.]